MPCFEFNTYTIAILVIFSLQKTYMLPKELLSSLPIQEEDDNPRDIEPSVLSDCLFRFFNLYGNEYKMNEDIISVNAGDWLHYWLDTDNASLMPPRQKR